MSNNVKYISIHEGYISHFDPASMSNEGRKGGNNGGGGDMEMRIVKLEHNVSDIKNALVDIKADINTAKSDIATLKTDMAVIKSNYAKKEDVTSSANKIILWVVGAVVFSQIIPAIPKIIETFGHLGG